MRKEKLITRRREWAEMDVLGFNIETSSAETRKFIVPTDIAISEDNTKVKGYINKINDDENFTPVKMLEYEIKSELRGMPESVFIANSHPIVNRHNNNEPEEN